MKRAQVAGTAGFSCGFGRMGGEVHKNRRVRPTTRCSKPREQRMCKMASSEKSARPRGIFLAQPKEREKGFSLRRES